MVVVNAKRPQFEAYCTPASLSLKHRLTLFYCDAVSGPEVILQGRHLLALRISEVVVFIVHVGALLIAGNLAPSPKVLSAVALRTQALSVVSSIGVAFRQRPHSLFLMTWYNSFREMISSLQCWAIDASASSFP